jgi:hypothetical protein
MTKVTAAQGIDIRTANRQEQKLFSLQLRATGTINQGRKRNLPRKSDFGSELSKRSVEIKKRELDDSRMHATEGSARNSPRKGFSPIRNKDPSFKKTTTVTKSSFRPRAQPARKPSNPSHRESIRSHGSKKEAHQSSTISNN